MPTDLIPMPISTTPPSPSGSVHRRKRPGQRQSVPPGKTFLTSIAVWILYVPHLAIVRLLGRRLAGYWIKLIAWLHWQSTFFGTNREALQAISQVQDELSDSASPMTTLRRHLLFKHQCFADLRLFAATRHQPAGPDGRRGRKGLFKTPTPVSWSMPQADRDAFQSLLNENRGVIVISYHYGHFRLAGHAAPSLFPETKFCQVRYPELLYAKLTYSAVARMAWQKGLLDDQGTDADVVYLEQDLPPLELIHRLRRQQVLLFAADGMIASHFVDVPFLGGTIRMPSGWAYIAGLTGAPVAVMMDGLKEGHQREIRLKQTLHCPSYEPDDVRNTVVEATSVLEQHVRSTPWAWHPWQRLQITDVDGVRKLALRSMGSGGGMAATESIDATDEVAVTSGKPRVAVVGNSFTPYRVQLHRRICREIPGIELYSAVTHAASFNRWKALDVPSDIRPVEFHTGEPSDQQTRQRYAVREWRKGGKIIEWLKREQIDAVLCQGYGDMGRLRIMRWCHANNVPCFLYSDANILRDRTASLKRWMKRLVIRRAVGWCRGVMPCGRNGERLFRLCGAEQQSTYYFPFVPDTELFASPAAENVLAMRSRFGFAPERRRVLFSGRLVRDKRPDLLLDAFTRIADDRPDWDLVYVGGGPLEMALRAQVPSRLKDRVMWTGPVDAPEELAAVFALCDVLVLPSDKEPWGVVIVEAAAAGMAIIASNVVGAAADLIDEGLNGLTFPVGDTDSLVQALKTITLHPHEFSQHSQTVLRHWQERSDPIQQLRRALAAAGL